MTDLVDHARTVLHDRRASARVSVGERHAGARLAPDRGREVRAVLDATLTPGPGSLIVHGDRANGDVTVELFGRWRRVGLVELAAGSVEGLPLEACADPDGWSRQATVLALDADRDRVGDWLAPAELRRLLA